MSFRKRGEVVSTGALRRGNPIPSNVGAGIARGTQVKRPTSASVRAKPKVDKSPIIKPSSVFTSENCVSSGSADLDKILVHGGIPIGSMILLEEDGTTDFGSRLIKTFLSEGVIQNRIEELDKKHLTHSVVVGMHQQWISELPGLYLGSSRERKKKLVKDQEGKLSVSNVVNSQNDMKIAWRYGLQKSKENGGVEEQNNDNYPHYNHQFDITTTIRPAASALDVSNVSIDAGYARVLADIERIVTKFPDQIVRIAIPYFLNPMIYAGRDDDESDIVSFIYGLRRIVGKYRDRIVLVMAINVQLYARTSSILQFCESDLFDGVIQLRPFPHELNELLDRTYKSEPAKIHQGYVNIYKLPILSDLGMMEVREMEFSFKNGKKRFEIQDWSIPVETENENTTSQQLEF